MKMISRRDFLKASAVVGAAAAMTALWWFFQLHRCFFRGIFCRCQLRRCFWFC